METWVSDGYAVAAPWPPPPVPAAVSRRFAAGLIDFAAAVGMGVGAAVVTSPGGNLSSTTLGGALRIAVVQSVVLLGPWVYLTVGWHRGNTLGTKAMGLRVLDADTMTLPSLGQCVRRAAGIALGLAALGAGVLWMAVDRRRRGWQDMLAGTTVVEALPGLELPPRAVTPRSPLEAEELSAPRRSWTWTDVVPALVLFYPLAVAVALVISKGVHAVHEGPITGTPRAVLGFLLDLVAYGLNVALVLVLVTLRRHRPAGELGLRLTDPRWLLAALPIAAGALLLSAILGGVSQALFPNTDPTQCKDFSQGLSDVPLLTVLAVTLIAPVGEEIVFRGFVLGWLQGRLPVVLAILTSAAIFSAAHFAYLQPTLFLSIFGIGVVLGGLYQLSKSVWPGVVVHGSLNLVAILVVLSHGC